MCGGGSWCESVAGVLRPAIADATRSRPSIHCGHEPKKLVVRPNPRGGRPEIAAIAFTADIAETNVRLAQSYRKLGDKL